MTGIFELLPNEKYVSATTRVGGTVEGQPIK